MDRHNDSIVIPDAWRSAVQRLEGSVTLDVAGFATQFTLSVEHLEEVYLPLLTVLDAEATKGRVLAGLAGVPGSGKSSVARLLQYVADAVWAPGRLVVVGMDGWHYPNAILEQRWITDPGGERIPLRKRKGGPESFDVSALVSALQLLRQAATVVRVPVYDRRLHEPVPDGLQITPAARIVLIEGNYLLSPSPPWDAVSGCLRPRLFLDVDLPAARERVIARHMRGGSSAEEAVARFEGNDRLNTAAVLATRSRADWLVSLTPSARLRSR